MALQFNTVAIPVTKGIDLRTAARLVEAPGLLRAENARFGKGSQKRFGYRQHKAVLGTYSPGLGSYDISTPTLTPYGAKTVDSEWLYGWGIMTEGRALPVGLSATVSPHPEPGYLFSGLTRDNEKVAWTGHSLISYAPSQVRGRVASTVSSACMPVLRSELIAKTPLAQAFPDAADNGKLRVVVWNRVTSGVTTARYSVFDSVTGAQLINDAALSVVTPTSARVFSLGSWFNIMVYSSDDGVLSVHSFSDTDPATVTSRSIATILGYWDVWKHNEERACVVYTELIGEADQAMTMTWVGPNGTVPSDEQTVTLDTDGSTSFNNVACAVHPITERVGVVFFTTTVDLASDRVMAGVYDHSGALAQGLVNVIGHDSIVATDNITVAPRYLLREQLDADGGEVFDCYYTIETDSATSTDEVSTFSFDQFEASSVTTIYHQSISSHAFRVGQKTFVWSCHKSLLQNTWFLLDSTLKPVGHMNFATAAPRAGSLCSVNFRLEGPLKDQAVFHLALGVRQRVQTTDDQEGLFTEESVQFVELDFLNPLRSIQAGRTTYIAGAQVWAYDGRELVEAGFHLAPEVTLTSADSGGTLDALQTFSYRIDLCYRNAQNEEIRSHSFITQHELTGTNDTITLTLKSVLTRRDDSYFLIFRNAIIDGAPTSTWNLLNSRDPSSADFLKNTQSSITLSYVDTGAVTNAAIVRRELHPGNSQTYLHPFAAPACEVIAAGRDRLWVAGGELSPGEIYPSRLFGPTETPTWNGNLVIQIDRNEAPITAIGFVGDIAVAFRERLTYIQEGDGPDNQGNGFWPPARLALADTGAKNQDGVVLCNVGLLFQSPQGFRLLSSSGQVSPIGQAVDDLAQDFTVRSAFCLARTNEVRWYGDTSTIVYNYLEDAWSTWTVGATAALLTAGDTRATLIKDTGHFWVEEEGYYRDGEAPYTHLIQFPWLHAGQVGDFQRLKRFAGLGSYTEDHRVRVEISYDERPDIEEYWEWDVPDTTQNTDTWGTQTWGAGTWGDTASTFWARDSVWRWRRMPRKQKCSVFSITISDNNTDGPGFSLVALGLELAQKKGLDRTAVPGGTNVNR